MDNNPRFSPTADPVEQSATPLEPTAQTSSETPQTNSSPNSGVAPQSNPPLQQQQPPYQQPPYQQPPYQQPPYQQQQYQQPPYQQPPYQQQQYQQPPYQQPPYQQQQYQQSTKPESPIYQKYGANVKKINILCTVLSILTTILILLLLFAPIMKGTVTKYSEDFENLEDFEEFVKNQNLSSSNALSQVLSTGKIEYNDTFSLFDEFRKNIASFSDPSIRSEFRAFGWIFALYPVLIIIYIILALCIECKKLFGTFSYYKNPQDSVLLLYTEIKKSGTITEKKKFFKGQTLFTIFSLFLLEIIFSMGFKLMLSDILSTTDLSRMSYFIDFSGFSGFGILIVLGLVTYIVLSSMKKKEEQALKLAIAKEGL